MAIKDEYQTQEGRISERKHVLHKHFLRDFFMGLFFIAMFIGVYLITWNILLGMIPNRGHLIWICMGVALIAASLITFLVNFLIFKLPGFIKKWKYEKAQKKRKNVREK